MNAFCKIIGDSKLKVSDYFFCLNRINMAGYTPPKIEDAPKSFIGVGTRELVIAAAGIALAVIVFLSDIYAPFRIGLAILCAGAGIGIAFGRDPKSGRKFEEMLAQILMFYGRDKFHQKGIAHIEKYDYSRNKAPKPKKESKAFFHVQPIDLTVSFILQLCSLAFLGVLITYLWGGGLRDDIFRYNANRG